MEKRFSLTQTLKESFNGVIDNFKIFALSTLTWWGLWFLVLGVLIVIGVAMVIKLGISVPPLSKEMLADKMMMKEHLMTLLPILPRLLLYIVPLWLIGIVISSGLDLGFIKIALNAYDKKENRVAVMFSLFGKVFFYLIAAFVYSLIVAGGTVLLVLPGIYWAVRFSLFPYILVDANAGIMESLRMSYRMTQGNFWPLFVLLIIIQGLTPLMTVTAGGLAALLLSLIVMPFAVLAKGVAYRKLSSSNPVV